MSLPPLLRLVGAIVECWWGGGVTSSLSQTLWPLRRPPCYSWEAPGTLFCVHRRGGLGLALYKLLMETYHDGEGGHGTSNYNIVHTGDNHIIYIERDTTYWAR